MKRYFVDSDFLVAMFNSKDASHAKAVEISNRLDSGEIELWGSNLIQQESATVVSHRVGMDAVRDFVKRLAVDIDRFVDVDKSLEKHAWGIFLKQTKKGCSFVDCANLAVIQKYKLDEILTFDEFYPRELVVK
ncbi:MAG: hypothetical protein UV33_C0031G0004 [Candidatus Daviesbacteria bacterium GW2011_GWA1_42_6]|uniref:PIN domain-containing protein n=1 Tax=Candidatus Daviesbacteria bacterium GW2011_GWA1_42_6 TaxID=1618420 RepID=A0A0G1ASZ3_9BACT|nr:MAG: hypothetical protein UV33_C0031G0004 [Candidatus Daviesbacteria bacterium GW2011_GWA1_42_6]